MLKPKEQLFAELYVKGLTVEQAAIEAGFKVGTYGYALLKSSEIQKYIQDMRLPDFEEAKEMAKRLIQEYKYQADFDWGGLLTLEKYSKQIDKEGNRITCHNVTLKKPTEEWTKQQRQCVTAIKVKNGSLDITFIDRNKALDKLAEIYNIKDSGNEIEDMDKFEEEMNLDNTDSQILE